MRTCMYCGRELEKGEKCTCPKSMERRGEAAENTSGTSSEKEPEKNAANGKTYTNPYRTKNSYKTGYAGGDNRFERARDRYKAKKAAKAGRFAGGGFWQNIWRCAVRALKTPVEAVTNPTQLGKAAMISIAAVMGALLWLCVFFILRGGAVGPFRLVAAAMGFGGGYRMLVSILVTLVSGAAGGVVMFFLYTGIFYLINRFLMRMQTPYWDFCVRLVSAWVPFTVICLIGTVLSLLSPLTLMALVTCGAVTAAVLTYEALKAEWYAFPPSKVVYSMLLGYFIFFSIMAHLMLL